MHLRPQITLKQLGWRYHQFEGGDHDSGISVCREGRSQAKQDLVRNGRKAAPQCHGFQFHCFMCCVDNYIILSNKLADLLAK